MPRVWMSPLLETFSDGIEFVDVRDGTISQIIDQLDAKFSGIKSVLVNDGDIFPGVAVLVDGFDAGFGMFQKVDSDSEIYFLPAIGGGS